MREPGMIQLRFVDFEHRSGSPKFGRESFVVENSYVELTLRRNFASRKVIQVKILTLEFSDSDKNSIIMRIIVRFTGEQR